MTLPLHTLAARTRAMIEADVDGEVVGLSPETNVCFGFNRTASELWRLLATPQTLRALVQQLTARFAVDDETCTREVSETLIWMEQQGLATLDRTPA